MSGKLCKAMSMPAGLHERIQEWHVQAGRPSTRELAAQLGCSHVTVADMLAGRRFTSLARTQALATALGGDAGEAEQLWLAGCGSRPGPDPEVTALRTVVTALGSVDSAARKRILGYVTDKFADAGRAAR